MNFMHLMNIVSRDGFYQYYRKIINSYFITFPDICDPNPCNGGICNADGSGNYSCNCSMTNFQGANCTEVINRKYTQEFIKVNQ